MTTLTVSDRPASDAKVDALVLATVTRGDGAALASGHGLGDAAAGHLGSALVALGSKGAADEVVKVVGVPGVAAALVVLTGLGKEPMAPTDDAPYEPEVLRRAAGAATRALTGTGKVAFAFPGTSAALVGAVAEGAMFGAYEFTAHRGKSTPKVPVKAVTVLASSARQQDVKAAVKRAGILASAQAYTRDLTNTAPNELYPQSFADSVKTRASGASVTVSVMDEKALAKAGCGGILGVGQGSVRRPRIVTMAYTPAKAKAKATLALVGKGITFDSGGLCIKPGPSMVTMKCDMGGAAAVAGAILAVAELGLPVAVTGYLCLAENMPGPDAQRPGDVVTMRGGKTVEIINTDAEGRMVLGDGLALASEQQPDAIVDIATLTGAAVSALGHRTAAVLGNDDDFGQLVRDAAGRAGESLWPMPIADEIRAGMDSLVADFMHTGDSVGGMMVAAAFLREFVGDGANGNPIPWAHLDIAGPAYNTVAAHGYTPKGATGFGVRTLVALVEAHA